MVTAGHGTDTENLIQAICTKMFFSDFTVRNPVYKKPSGQEKEAADILIPFKNTLIAFQVKSKEETRDANEKTITDWRRINRRVDAGAHQLRKIKEAVKGNLISRLTTVRGMTIPFDSSNVHAIIGVVVLNLVGEERFPEDFRTTLLGGYGVVDGIPCHIFMREDFQAIAGELDTIPDFIRYLEVREVLRRRNILSPATQELDFLVLYKTRLDIIEEFLSGKRDLLVITPGVWESYCGNRTLLEQRNKANLPSYAIDEIINWLHTSVGFGLQDVDIEGVRRELLRGTIDNYVASVTELASLTRLERRAIGQKLLEKARKADSAGQGYALAYDQKIARGIIVLSSNERRADRIKYLHMLCCGAYCLHSLRKVIGIATEPLSAPARSYDLIIMENVSFENTDELARHAMTLFQQGRHTHVEEYK